MALDELLEVPGDLEALTLPARHHVGTYLLLFLEEVLRTLATNMPKASFTYHSPSDTGETSYCPAPALGPTLQLEPLSLPLSPQSCPW